MVGLWYRGRASLCFFNDTATTEIYTLSLHDALPISGDPQAHPVEQFGAAGEVGGVRSGALGQCRRHVVGAQVGEGLQDRKSTRLNSSHANISYAVFCLKKKTPLYIPILHLSY